MHFQHSEWRWSDGSSAHISWGLGQMYPDHAALLNERDYCPRCSDTLLHGVSKLKSQMTQDTSHCSIVMLSPDLEDFSVIPVNCSMNFWSRIFCVGKSNNTVHQESTDDNAGRGEYTISHNTLAKSNYMCPRDHNIVMHGMCLKLTLLQDKVMKYNIIYNFMNAYKHKICKGSKSYAEVLTNMNNDTDLIHDILDEFYAKGSELFLGHEMINPDRHVWFTPPLYPTYTPCFTERIQVMYDTITNSIEIFSCQDGSFIPSALLCNGRADCTDAEDEQQCSICSEDSPGACYGSCTFPNCRCDIFYYQCQAGGCVHYDQVCDSIVDCPDGDDERGCHQKKTFYDFSETSIRMSYFTGLCDPPIGDMLMCRSVSQCYNSSAICHYDHSGGVMAHCEDGSHLGTGSLCQYVECPQHYKCHASYCIPSRKICDGVIDCPTGDDEASCADFRCSGHLRCSGVHFCVPPHEVCDGIAHCPSQDDEKYCQACPQGCQCRGTAIYCQHIDTLTLNGGLLSPSALVLHNSFEMFSHLYHQCWVKMQHLWLVDLNNGSFASYFGNETLLSEGLVSVKILHLTHQGLHTISPYFINGQSLTHVNLSNNVIHTVKRNAFAQMQNLKILSLVCNKLRSLESHFFLDLKSLSYLYLSDNQLVNIAADVFQGNPGLVLVRSDWYMVCCVVIEVEDCYPQNQFVSSCSHLIPSVLQKTVIILQGIIVILTNVGALIIQFTLVHNSMAEKYLIVSLAFADLMMGLYLLAIAYVDLTYSATFHKIISEWTSGLVCIVFGLVNFMSSEVSLLVLSLMSFVRVISIDKVGGMSFMESKIWKACVCIWFAVMTIGILYSAYVFTSNIGLRNNMCLFFGVSHQRFITQIERAFQSIFLGFNMFLLATLSFSIFGIARAIAKSNTAIRKVSGQQNVKLQEKRFHRACFKLSLLLVCSVFTWLPFLIVSVLLLSGISVHDSVLQWVIVLGIPLCSSSDPILYNMATFKSYIQEKLMPSKTKPS